MSWQKRGKIFLSEVWIKKAEGCDINQALKKKVYVLVFLSLLVTSVMDT